MPAPRVLILYNEPTLPAGHPDASAEHDVLDLADVVERILRLAGATVGRLGVVDSAEVAVAGLRAFAPDVVFNLHEGTASWGNAEAYIAGIVELFRVPYTGSPPQTLLVARSKPLTKLLLTASGMPTAPYFLVTGDQCPPNRLGWPVIVKPAGEDASIGIEQKSVCTTDGEVADRVRYVQKTYGPGAVIERLIVGRELHVAVIDTPGGLTVLPFTEILFPPAADGRPIWPIVTFDAKWHDDSRDYQSTPYKNPADVAPALEREVGNLAQQAFALVGCRDYARIDFRVDEAGRPFVLEVNPNPCIMPGAGVAESLASAHIPYPDFILSLVRAALRRGPAPALADSLRAVDPAAARLEPEPDGPDPKL
jgi:D-alanine-D-alanine ligase